MAAINEEVLIRFKGQDDTGSALNSVKSKIQSLQKENTRLAQSMNGMSSQATKVDTRGFDRYTISQNKAYQQWLNNEDKITKKISSNNQKISNLKKQQANNVSQSNNQISQSYQRMSGVVSSAMGMLGGMIGYELVNGLVTAGREAINASQQFDYFAGRLGKSKGETEAFRNSVKDMQKDFKKVNMESIGATAMDIALRNGMQGTNEELSEITKMSAVMASEFKRNGRTEEDSIMAVNDALDGQFRRLQEIGISQDDLKKNGWNGDINDKIGLVKALNKTMEDMGYDKTAKDITNLDDAWAALTVSGGNLLKEVLLPMMPAFLSIIDGITDLVSGFSSMPQEFKNIIAYGIAGGAALLVFAKAAGSVRSALDGLKGFSGLFGKIFSTGGGVAGGAGGAGGEATGKGIVATLKGLKGFGRALLGLVPDIIMAAAAVAVIIAVLFALAAEVIVLTKGIQMLIDAMHFGDIDLNDDIEGLKKLGQAMWEIASILGAMAVANVANVVTQVTGGIINLAVGLKTIKDAYKKVVDAVNEIKNMGDIDQGGLDKLKKLGDAMKSIGDIALGLSNVNGSMNIGSAINNFVATLTGGESDIGANITTLINKVREIAPKFEELKTLPDIDQSGVDKIKKVGDAIKSIGEAATSMQGVQGGFVGAFMDWWQGDLQSQVDKAIEAIKQIAGKLQGLGSFNIPDVSWVERVAVGIASLKNAANQINQFAGFVISPDVQTNVSNAVTTVQQVAQQLSNLSGTTIGDVSSILGQIQSAIDQMKAVLASANFNAEGVQIGQSLTTGVQSGLSGLPGVVGDASNQAVSTAEGILPPGMGNVASNATNSFRDNLKLADIASQEMDYAVQAINNKSGALYEAAKNAAQQAVQGGRAGAQTGSPGAFARMWGKEVGDYSPYLIGKNAPKLYTAMKNAASNAVNSFGHLNLGFGGGSDLLNKLPAMNTGYTTPQNGDATGNTYYIGEGAFNIHVSDMTDQECKSVILQALESL